MSIAQTVTKHKIGSFLVGTILVQACALSAAFYLRGTSSGGVAFESSASPSPVTERVTPETLGALEAPPAIDGMVALPATATNHTVKRGDTLSSIWTAHGAARSGGLLAAKALKEADPKAAVLKEGDVLELSISASGDIVALKRRYADSKVVELTGDSTSGYTAQISELAVTESARTVSGTITDSFALAADDLDVPPAIVDDLVDLFSARVAFERAIQAGDTFTVTFTERRLLSGELVAPGEISHASIATGGKLLAAIRYMGADNKARYYSENGAAIGNTFLRYPLKFSRISSVFTKARFHPVLKTKRPHNGVDFAAPVGTPVRSVAEGSVVFAGWTNGGGYTVRVKHCARYTTEYMHLSKFAKGLRVGSAVSRGEVIAAVGQTGLASGPHLHFALYDKGRYVNPLSAELPTVSDAPALPPSYLVAALDVINASQAQVRLAHAGSFKRPA